jgi:DNA-binding transcriptional regulator YiaG
VTVQGSSDGAVLDVRSHRLEQAMGTVPGDRWSATRIRALRKRLGLSQAAFGRLVGVTPVAVYFWEAGRTQPRGRSLEELAALDAPSEHDGTKGLGPRTIDRAFRVDRRSAAPWAPRGSGARCRLHGARRRSRPSRRASRSTGNG